MWRLGRGDGVSRRGQVRRKQGPLVLFRSRRRRELRRISVGDGDVGGAASDFGSTVLENPFHRPDQSVSPRVLILSRRCPYRIDTRGTNFLCHCVRFCFALAIPLGARCTTTPHSCRAVRICVSPLTGPLNPRSFQLFQFSWCPSCTSTPRRSASRSARSRFRSMLVKKLKSWSIPSGVASSARLTYRVGSRTPSHCAHFLCRLVQGSEHVRAEHLGQRYLGGLAWLAGGN